MKDIKLDRERGTIWVDETGKAWRKWRYEFMYVMRPLLVEAVGENFELKKDYKVSDNGRDCLVRITSYDGKIISGENAGEDVYKVTVFSLIPENQMAKSIY